MAADPEPPELARLVDLSERPHGNGWSLRAALVRYAQPEPVRSSAVLAVVRRLDAALAPHAKLLRRSGPAVYAALVDQSTPPADAGAVDAGAEGDDATPYVVEVLRVAQDLDRLGAVIAGWAEERAGDRPDVEVDRTLPALMQRLDDLGAPTDTDRQRPPRQRA